MGTGIWRYIVRQINVWFGSSVVECRGGIPEALLSNPGRAPLTQPSFGNHRLLFSHASTEVRGEYIRRKVSSPQPGIELTTTWS